jgi:hypothetical protein
VQGVQVSAPFGRYALAVDIVRQVLPAADESLSIS